MLASDLIQFVEVGPDGTTHNDWDHREENMSDVGINLNPLTLLMSCYTPMCRNYVEINKVAMAYRQARKS